MTATLQRNPAQDASAGARSTRAFSQLYKAIHFFLGGPQEIWIYPDVDIITLRRRKLAFSRMDGPASNYSGSAGVDSRTLAKARKLSVILKVPLDSVLRQCLVLPLAAKRRLPSTVRYGLSAWTPFAEDEVHFLAHVTETRGPNAIGVEVQYVPKTQLDQFMSKWTERGLAPDVLALSDYTRDRIDLGTEKHRRILRGKRLELGLALLMLLQLLIYGGSGIYRTERELSIIETKGSIASRELAAQMQLSDRIEQLKIIIDAAKRKRKATENAGNVLDALTLGLDSNAWVRSVRLIDGKWSARIAFAVGGAGLSPSFSGSILKRTPVVDTSSPGTKLQMEDLDFAVAGNVGK